MGLKTKARIPKKEIFLSIIILFLPFIAAAVILLVNGYKLGLKMLVPVWGDEIGWWYQVASLVKYNGTLGIWGYNLTHAQWGTWGPWGIAPLLPYALFGKIFGWQLYSMALANMSFLSISMFLFTLLANLKWKQKLCLIIIYFCLPIVISYSFTSMSESLRYSLSVLLTGILIWAKRGNVQNQKLSGFKYAAIVVGICFVLFYAVAVYLILALFVPLILFYLFKRFKKVTNLLLTIAVFFIVLAGAYIVATKYSSPYVSSTIANILNVFHTTGLYRSLCYLWTLFWDNISTISLTNIIKLFNDNDYSILPWFFIIYITIFTLLAYKTVNCALNALSAKSVFKAQEKVAAVGGCPYAVPFYIMAAFLFGYCLLYTGVDWTLCRGINTGLLCAALYLVSASDTKVLSALFWLAVVSSISTVNLYKNSLKDRYESWQLALSVFEQRVPFEEVFKKTEEYNSWENTIAVYNGLNSYKYILPVGYGIHTMLLPDPLTLINNKALYVIASEEFPDLINALISNQHEIIFNQNGTVVLKYNGD